MGQDLGVARELGTAIDYYPGGTTATMKELGEGTRDMIVTTCGWDINPRALGIVPKEVEVFALEGTRWIPDTQFMCMPKGVPDDKVAVLLQLMSFMLKPEQQALTYDKGYFYPGPAVKGVTLDMAPQESRDILKEFGRPLYDRLIAELPDRSAARARPAGRGLPALGPGDRRQEGEVAHALRRDRARPPPHLPHGGRAPRRRRDLRRLLPADLATGACLRVSASASPTLAEADARGAPRRPVGRCPCHGRGAARPRAGSPSRRCGAART